MNRVGNEVYSMYVPRSTLRKEAKLWLRTLAEAAGIFAFCICMLLLFCAFVYVTN